MWKEDIAGRLGTVPYTLAEWKQMMDRAGLADLWAGDWSTPENALKIRPMRYTQPSAMTASSTPAGKMGRVGPRLPDDPDLVTSERDRALASGDKRIG